MSDWFSATGDTLNFQCVAEQSVDLSSTQRSDNLAEPLQVMRLSLQSVEVAKKHFPDYRLSRLVSARLDLDEFDMLRLPDILGANALCSTPTVLHPFNDHLRHLIACYDLKALFNDCGHAPHHHAIRPTGYDFDRGEVNPIGMEQWRANYRGMSDERQMLAASIVWLYRAGKDNIWLRRVPCTWHAADAIACMKATNVFSDWAQLFAQYPGW